MANATTALEFVILDNAERMTERITSINTQQVLAAVPSICHTGVAGFTVSSPFVLASLPSNKLILPPDEQLQTHPSLCCVRTHNPVGQPPCITTSIYPGQGPSF
jgi:hypothetical protein